MYNDYRLCKSIWESHSDLSDEIAGSKLDEILASHVGLGRAPETTWQTY